MIALKTAEGTILPFRMLSDGYRNVIKIILDIATRMCILNENTNYDNKRDFFCLIKQKG